MPRIICADLRCKYNKNKKCTAKEVNLSSNSIVTLWEGRKEFNTCRTMEYSDEWLKLKKVLKEMEVKNA